MTKFEIWMLDNVGMIISLFGLFGSAITFYIDEIRSRPVEIGWLQICGIVFFFVLFLFGIVVKNFMRDVKELLQKYLSI